ncbi:ABC transporter substrate-binding protein [Parapusillimonas sp. JC17]|uniref:ABC transporter substrate-binding protein n=1 Tax=Parapusillimonas sp. JC17 TaxID=3445768 RepID=UPI003FA0C99F
MKLKKRLMTMGFAALVGIGGLAGTAAQAKDKFVFAWPSAINSGVAPLTYAKTLGYWDAENIDLTIQVLTGSGVIVPQLLAGNIHGAYSSLETLVVARQPGKPNYPIIFPYNYLRNSIWEFAVLKDSPINELSDMKGATIGVLALTSGNIFMSRAMLESQGVASESVKFLGVGTGSAAFDALKSGQIGVLNLFDTAHVRAEQNGIPIRRVDPPKDYQGISSHGISVTEAFFEKNKDLVARFGRALTKGTLACNANLESCIRSYWEAYPAMKPRPDLEKETLQRETEVLQVRMKNLMAFNDNEAHEYGKFSEKDWSTLISALEAGKEITVTDIPFNKLYTNELVPAYNDFDVDKVVKQAQNH